MLNLKILTNLSQIFFIRNKIKIYIKGPFSLKKELNILVYVYNHAGKCKVVYNVYPQYIVVDQTCLKMQ